MDIAFLFPFILLIGVMFLMTRSAKNRQRQALEMRDSMEPGSGVRTIGGMYAEVKEVREDTVLLEVAPGVQAIYAKNAIGAVLDPEEYDRIVSGDLPEDEDSLVVPDDASSLTAEETEDRVELEKSADQDDVDEPEDAAARRRRDQGDEGEGGSKA
ncbi:preprotein translocase subunit YajC [Streptomyces sp. 3MP-14]|uniref:Preprotein translocase subunit YajC n=1 Tax=Streptomyces mimosae TaxID=2586635 RepID=A0A5N6A3P7_9ACTN|nr:MULTISPECIES: preprotein translocase subunit YajC [Streptomyces]KAB8162589.1 preprotein translocase subunit YajC [Streptomyces mimosae]KAB8174416.1 preprotein translocase subunit YajC [Streptomyces sp. 3MP-14]